MTEAVEFIDIDWAGRRVRIEHQWIAREKTKAPLIVFLHEGLGSVAMWKDFPQRLCIAAGCRGLVYSRPGYGRSSPRAAEEAWGLDFMHRQAQEVLPALLEALRKLEITKILPTRHCERSAAIHDVQGHGLPRFARNDEKSTFKNSDSLSIDAAADRLWLLGHSDGGSIALLYAASHLRQIAGAIVLAPHILVEDLSVSSIEKVRTAYLETDLRERLARHHDDPDSAFWGWNDIWLHPEFKHWSIEAEIGAITCPLLAVQGLDDEYGTLAQVRGIARRVPQTELLELADCGHSPHRDQSEKLIAAITAFIERQPHGDKP